MTLSKAHSVERLFAKNLFSNTELFRISGRLSELLNQSLEHGEDVLISGFGKFSVREKHQRRVRKPQTDEPVTFRPLRVVTFRHGESSKRSSIRNRRQGMRRYAVLLVTLLTLSAVSLVYAGLDDAESAYRRKDYVKAAKDFKILAEHGNAEAQLHLGLMYDGGQGVPRDYSEAVRWFRKAAEQGLAQAQLKLGLMYDEGRGVPRDYSEALKWFLKAAEQGMTEAQFNLGLIYHEGEGVPQDYPEAMKWLRRAAEHRDASAQYNLGVMYTKGDGVPQDLIQAHLWFDLAAAQGNSKAQTARDKIAAELTPSQIAEAQRLAKEWRPQGQEK
jgi:nucleoid DNA-binding protein